MSSSSKNVFVPKQFVSITLDKTTVYVYPTLTTSMNENEKTYGFGITKNALKAASRVSYKTRLECLKQNTNSVSTIDVVSNRFVDYANDFITKVNNLTVKSYHGNNGRVIPDCTDPSNGHLLPTQNMRNADRRPSNIRYVKVSSSIDFSPIDPNHKIKYPFTFYIDLEITSRVVQNSTGGDVNLTTFFGSPDWAHDTQEKFDEIIKSDKAVGQPFDLKPPSITDDINLEAIINVNFSTNRLEEIALEASWDSVTKTVYKEICPTAISDPCSALQNIRQSLTNDTSGERESRSVQDYYIAIKQYTDFFPKKGDWPMDVVQHFITHLDEEIRQQTKKDFSYNPATSKKDAYTQSSNLLEALRHATTAEEQKTSLNNTIAQHFQGTQTMIGTVNMSVAERTIREYTQAPITRSTERSCWGCGSKDHTYAIKQTITCPNKDLPGVAEKAAKVRADFNERRRAIRKKRKSSSDNNSDGKQGDKKYATLGDIKSLIAKAASPSKSNDFVCLMTHTNQCITSKEASLFRMLMSDNAMPKFDSLELNEDDDTTPCLTACVLASGTAIKPPLPMNFDSNLPHLNFNIGEQEKTFKISVAYDTCAVLNVGYSGYHLTIAKNFPAVVKSLTWAKQEFSPLILSGIVSDEDENEKSNKEVHKLSTLLPATIEYFTPYITKEGSPVTLKVALGNKVGVNTIMGLSTIKNAKISLDLDANVFDAGILSCDPFEIIFKPTSRGIPDLSPLMAHPLHTEMKSANQMSIQKDDAVKCYNSEFKDEIDKTIDENFHPSLTETLLDKDSTPITESDFIKVPKKKYRKKLASKWSEPAANNINDNGFRPVQEHITKPSTSLRRNINEFNNPTQNPSFHYIYSEEKDKSKLNKQIQLEEHLSSDLKNRIRSFVIKYYDIFREEGLSIPVRGYEMVIDTGTHQPVCVPQPHYGLNESPIMQKSIDSLLKLGFIKPDLSSPWGSRITLAPKPHQEEVRKIDDFIWRFCINYIHLNRITRPTSYPIPRCDDAVMYGFGNATFFILMDAHSGYHQVSLSPESMLKTAFFAPHGRKYVYVVMPFGLRNAPAVFVAMMHDLKALWSDLCDKNGVKPSENEGTTIIIDDIFLFAVSEDNAFIILQCIAIISRKYHLTMKLKKCQWFPQEVEFVGVDISVKGNSPARSKFEYLQTWKTPTSPRQAMSFVGFAMFYSKWIPFFEIKITPIRDIIKKYHIDHKFKQNEFSDEAIKAYNVVKNQILSKPILQRADINLRMYLKTDFSSLSLGFAVCQPAKDSISIEAMNAEIKGGECKFDLTLKGLRLLPIAFGSRRTVGNEKHFHSYPGEALCASWAIIKNRHLLWGREFTLLTDCRALLWILNYKGHNHAVKRLQLELNGYYFTICHRPGRMMEDANYLSRLDQEVSIDPLLKDYLSFARQSYMNNTPPFQEMNHDNLPGRRKRKVNQDNSLHSVNFAQLNCIHNEYIEIKTPRNFHFTSFQIQNIPISFANNHLPINKHPTNSTKQMRNHYCASTASTLSKSNWCLFEPQYGHWIETTRLHPIPFDCIIAIESKQSCRNILQHSYNVPLLFNNLYQTRVAINQPTFQCPIQGYHACISKATILSSKISHILHDHVKFIDTLHNKCHLKVAMFEFHHEVPSAILHQFKSLLKTHNWTNENKFLDYKSFSDRITGSVTIVSAMHNHFQSTLIPIQMINIIQPPISPNSMEPKILSKFNVRQYAIPDLEQLFKIDIIHDRVRRTASPSAVIRPKTIEAQIDTGYQIYDTSFPAPLPNQDENGLFGQLFGIVFRDNILDKALCRSISSFEYISLFEYGDNFTYNVSQMVEDMEIMTNTTPNRTMYAIINACYECLFHIQQQEITNNSALLNTDLSPSVFLNGAVSHRLPHDDEWDNCYSKDDDCNQMIKMIQNPSLITQENVKSIHFIYRMPIRSSTISYENHRLILHEPTVVANQSIKLIIVPKDLRKHIFNSFHTNPLGGHFSLYQTLHRIRLRFHWPGMFKYIKSNINSCVACVLKNNAARPASEFLYSFPLDAPMNTIHADLWQPGNQRGYEGSSALMIVVCHMTTFVAIEPIKECNSKNFAKSVYRIMMRYGLASLIVTDPDSKFKGEFGDMCSLLDIPHHMSARGNHNAIIVERFNKFLNSGMRIFSSERGTVRVFQEAAETLCYAWNSAPVSGTDLSRSLLMVGREFKFPIDIVNNKHITFNIDETKIRSFANDLISLITKCREVYILLINEHRAMHREYRNSQLHNPKKFNINDIVFTNVQIQSKSSTGKVKKLSYTRRGPYKIVKIHPSGSYDLTLTSSKSNTTIKKHGSELILCPKDLIPHQPIQSSDHTFSELNKKSIENPFSQAHIQGYLPTKPWEAAAAATSQLNTSIDNINQSIPPFPSVEELDADYDSWPESGNPFTTTDESDVLYKESGTGTIPSQNNTPTSHSNDYAVHHLANPTNISAPPSKQSFSSLIQSIIISEDKLFFILYNSPNENRKEWKLVQLDFQLSIRQHPSCLQDGKFIFNFLIQHPKDDHVSSQYKRYWIEYHKILNPKRLHTNYHLIQPSDISPKLAFNQELTPYREWFNLRDQSIILNGPFEFATLNNRKTRDRISLRDWQILHRTKSQYDNDSPTITDMPVQFLHWHEPLQIIGSNTEVTRRITTFTTNLSTEINDTISSMFGSPHV